MSFDRSKIVFDRSSEKMTNLLDSIDTQLLVDRSNVPFRSIEHRSSTDQARQIVRFEYFNFFSTDRGAHSMDRKLGIHNFF